MKLKVLPLEPWIKHSKPQQFLDMGYLPCNPRFNRDGWYLEMDRSWFEVKGHAFVGGPTKYLAEDFKFTLEQLNHRPLHPKCRQAIHVLITENLASQQLKHLYYVDTTWHDIRNVYRNTRNFYLYKEQST